MTKSPANIEDKNMDKILFMILAILVCFNTPAEAGKSTRQSYRSSPPIVHNHTTIIQHDHGSSMPSFMFGYMMGHTASPQPQTIIVQPQAQLQEVPAAPVVKKETVMVKEDSSLSPFQVFMMMCAGVGIVIFLVGLARKHGL